MEPISAPVLIGAFLILFGTMFSLTVAVFMACCCIKRFNDGGRVIQGTEIPNIYDLPIVRPARGQVAQSPTAPPTPAATATATAHPHAILVIQPDEDETLAIGIK